MQAYNSGRLLKNLDHQIPLRESGTVDIVNGSRAAGNSYWCKIVRVSCKGIVVMW